VIRSTTPIRLFAAALLVVLPAGTAAAGILPLSVTVTPEAGNFRWTYAVVLPTDMKLQAGDYFTIYDFGGLVDGTIVAPDGWAGTVGNAGPIPVGLHPNDSAALPNLTFKYSGPTALTGQVGLGNFWAVSTVGTAAVTEFTAQNRQASSGELDRNIVGTIAPGVPDPIDPPSGVPEPTTLALAAIGLPLLAARRRFKR
jgi:hypothetical protein